MGGVARVDKMMTALRKSRDSAWQTLKALGATPLEAMQAGAGILMKVVKLYYAQEDSCGFACGGV